MKHIVKSFCRNCSSMCGISAEVDNNKIVTLKGDPNHPVTKGYFCVKALSSMDLQNGEDRMLRPQVRTADGSRADIEVEQAMDEIHEKLSRIIHDHGPHSVALYFGTGAYNNSVTQSAMKGWFHQLGSPYVFSSMTLDQSAKWVTAARMGAFATGTHNCLDADVLMLVGMNPAASHSSAALPNAAPMKGLAEARKRGMKLIMVDPCRTATARQADLHLQIIPGEDAVLFAGLIRAVLERGWQDNSFCERFVVGVEALRQAVEPFTLDLVEARTGVSQALTMEAAELFSSARRKSAESGTGPNMSPDSNVAEHMLAALNAICGAYRRCGDVVHNTGLLYGRPVTQEMVVPPNRSWERGPKLPSTDIGPLFGEYPTSLLPREIMADPDNKIRALIVVGGNPLKALSDPDKATAAFGALELLVDINPRQSETGAMAHYAIPTSIPYERHDYTGMYDGHFFQSFAQIARPVVERPDGIIDDWEFFWGMAKRAGKPLELKQCCFGVAHRDIPGPTLTLDLQEKPNAEDLLRWFCSHGRVSYDQLAARPEGIGVEEEVVIRPASEDHDTRLDLCPADVAAELASVLGRTAPGPAFPYSLTVRRLLESHNSAWQNSSRTRRRYPVNPAFMNPDDMSENGIEQGSRIRIRSESGAVIAVAKPDKGLRRGVIALTNGWGAVDRKLDPEGKTGAFVGELISIERDLQSINYMPQFSAVPVTIEKVADVDRSPLQESAPFSAALLRGDGSGSGV